MKKILVLVAALLIASASWGAYRDLNVTGNTILGDAAVDTVTTNATQTFAAATAFQVGTVLLPGIYFTGDPNTGFYWIGADDIGITAAGGAVGNFDATGLNTCDIGQTNAAEGDFTTGSFTGDADFSAGLVTQPSITFTGDLDTGLYWIGADNFGFATNGVIRADFDNTGLNTCILGATTPADATVTTFTATGQADLAVGAVGAPAIVFTGSLTTGLYEVAADSPGMSVAGALVGTWDAAGYQGDLGQTAPGAVDATTLTTTGITDLFVGAVGAPSLTFTGDPDSGLYWIGADDIGVAANGVLQGNFDATGLNNCIIGATVASAGTFTTVDGTTATFTDDLEYGQEPGDLHTGYKRTEMIKFVDGFNMGVDVQFALIWDLTGVVGAGTNVIAATPGWNVLTTGGGGAGNTESTLSFVAHHYPAYTPRIECSMAVPVLANTEAWFGFYNAANDYVYLEYDASASGNWFISADDAGGVGPDTMDTGVLVTVAAQKLEITISAAGVVDCAINDVDIDCTALGTDMTANGHQTYWRVMEEAAGATAIHVDYIEEEQLKMQ